MSDEQDKDQDGIVGWIIGIAAFIAVAVALWMGLWGALPSLDTNSGGGESKNNSSSTTVGTTAPASVTAPAPTVTAAAALPGAAATPSATIKPETLKVYFGTASVELPQSAADGIKPFVTYAQSSPNTKLQISGFHDKTGSVEQNAELSKNRAKALREALITAGVPQDRIVLLKPTQSTGGGDDKEARRVELSAVQ